MDINTSPPNDTFMRQWIDSALFKIMACRLTGAKPFYNAGLLSIGPVGAKFSEISIKKYSQKYKWKHRLRNGVHFVQVEMS